MINSFKGRYRFLSNFFPCDIEMDGNIYSSVEHAYQAAKTKDQDWRERIYCASTPSEAKAIGRKIPLREDWEEIKIDVMKELLEKKFENEELKELLLETGKEELVEGNWWGDTFWGECRGVGENYLGRLLMEIRATL